MESSRIIEKLVAAGGDPRAIDCYEASVLLDALAIRSEHEPEPEPVEVVLIVVGASWDDGDEAAA